MNGVVFFQTAGGFGNELNSVMKAVLVALQSNRTLCAHELKSRTLGFMASPLTSAMDSARNVLCTSMMKESVAFTSVEHIPRSKNVAINTGTWGGHDRGFKSSVGLARMYGIDYSLVLACISNALFRPDEEVRKFSAPYLKLFHEADISIGVHIRSGDYAMARHQGYVGNRQLSLAKHRAGSISENLLASRIMENTPLHCSHAKSIPRRAVVFVSADRTTEANIWRNITPVVTVLKTPGHPVHTGRASSTAACDREGALKAVADFFILTETEWFASNVNYAASTGNTYAQNIHLHRSPSSERLERVAPNYDCHVSDGPKAASTESRK